MKKISFEEYNKLNDDQRAILSALGIEPSEASPRNPKMEDTLVNEYACIVETSCLLCKTVSTQVFLMEGTGGLLISRPAELSELTGMTIKTRTESTYTCPSCRDILKLMCQEDLIALTLKAAKGDTRCTRRN